MSVLGTISLRNFNTFGIDLQGNVASFNSVDELDAIRQKNAEPPALVLGGGSNILFVNPPKGWIWKNEILGIHKIDENNEHVYVNVGAGEEWHPFVLQCLKNDWGGLENLSLIPGRVGASPMQNIGAYGVEIKDVFHSLRAYRIEDGRIETFSNADCRFGYRESVFKQEYKNRYIILDVTYKLTRQKHILHLDYGDIRKELEHKNVQTPNIHAVSEAVCAIRKSKLPDPALLGNAGSFFKNPVISKEKANALLEQFPGMPQHATGNETVKLAAGWLIEKAGWKGMRRGDAGVHEKQALVLVNYGTATGKEIWNVSEEIVLDIQSKFGIVLEREVNIIE
ncbi:MAG: UDP-N-acetylmuramate dehydrogenase [Bacteroidia bacterium]